MTRNITPFNNTNYDLGMDNEYGGVDQVEVDTMLKNTVYDTSPRCAACGSKPKYKLLAKPGTTASEDVRKNGYLCGHCATKLYKQYENTYILKELR